jgi:hypothetical protein
MRKSALITAAIMLAATSAWAAAPHRFFELPKFTQPPTLDGDRSTVAGEWAGALEFECSPSQILRDGAEFGWRDLQAQSSEVSVNQLVQSADEDAAVARTDADVKSTIWQAWDDDALYYIVEVADNARDVVGGERLESWWERDSMSLYVDLNNEDTGGDTEGSYTGLNIVNFVAAPMNSSPVTVTLETTVQNARQATQDPDAVEGFTYGFRDAGDEFGGIDNADYCIEGKMEWDAFMRVNLNSQPTVGTNMGFSWLLLDPDGDDAYGGQIQCVAWAGGPEAEFADWVFSATKAGPGAGTPVEQDSWGRVKATFAQ